MKDRILEYYTKHTLYNSFEIEDFLGMDNIRVLSEQNGYVKIAMLKPFLNIIRFFLLGYIALGYEKPISIKHVDHLDFHQIGQIDYYRLDIFNDKSSHNDFPINKVDIITGMLQVCHNFVKPDIETFKTIIYKTPLSYQEDIIKMFINGESDIYRKEYIRIKKPEFKAILLKWINETKTKKEGVISL